jgi:hypothetical protein
MVDREVGWLIVRKDSWVRLWLVRVLVRRGEYKGGGQVLEETGC